MTESNTKIIDAKTAARIAADYYRQIASSQNQAVQVQLTIEEIELDDNDEYWHITLGIFDPNTFNPSFGPDSYKVFKISAKDGKVRSMKIRDIG